MKEAPDMIEGMENKKQEVNLGKAAIFLGIICVLGLIAASSSGAILYGVVGVGCGILAVVCYVLWSVTKKARNR